VPLATPPERISKPPLLTVVPLAVPTGQLAVPNAANAPPDPTSSMPPLLTVVPVSEPPKASPSTPSRTTVPVAVPWKPTTWLPPALTMLPIAVPAVSTAKPLRFRIVPLATPPDRTSSPPLLTVVPTAVPPDNTMSMSPAFNVRPLNVWPECTVLVVGVDDVAMLTSRPGKLVIARVRSALPAPIPWMLVPFVTLAIASALVVCPAATV
jgi:hypothetical protein